MIESLMTGLLAMTSSKFIPQFSEASANRREIVNENGYSLLGLFRLRDVLGNNGERLYCEFNQSWKIIVAGQRNSAFLEDGPTRSPSAGSTSHEELSLAAEANNLAVSYMSRVSVFARVEC